MIGLLIKIFSEELDGQATIKEAFKPQQFDNYLAPGEGLYLNRVTFESYNNRKDIK
jgi:tRNA U38,U39,U40 pseudouridine synthase TruA